MLLLLLDNQAAPLVPVLRTREPPDELALYLLNPDGSEQRLAGDERNATLSEVSVGTSLPGGFSEATATVFVPEGELRIAKFTPVVVRGPDRTIVWEGRVESTPQTSDERTIDLSLIGHQAALLDNPSVTFLGVDNDLTQWGDPPEARVQYLSNAGTSLNTNFEAGTSDDTAYIKMQTNVSVPADAVGELWYTAPGQLKVAEVQWVGLALQVANMEYFVSTATNANGTGESSRALTAAGDLALAKESFTPAIIGKWAFFTMSPTAAVNKANPAIMLLLKIAVFGDHGLPRAPIDFTSDAYVNVDGLRFSDIAAHLVGKYTRLRTNQDGRTTVEDSTYVMPSAVWSEPTTVAQIIEEGIGFEPDRDWAVWEEQTFHYRAKENFGRDWVIRRSDGARLVNTGETAEADVNGVVVSFQARDGVAKSVGPPGSGSDIEDASLLDENPENPVNASQSLDDRYTTVNLELSNAETAIRVGQAALKEALRTHFTGEAELPRYLQSAEGEWLPSWMVRAGDRIIDADRVDAKPMQLVGTSYSRGGDRPLTATIDTPANRIDALVSRTGGISAPVPVRRIKRAGKRKLRERTGEGRKTNPTNPGSSFPGTGGRNSGRRRRRR